MLSLIKTIHSKVPLTSTDEEFIQTFFKRKVYARGEMLLRAGEVPHEIFFITEGVVHQFYLDEEGREHSCNFCFENDFITDLESFSEQIPSSSNITALKKTICLSVRCIELVELFQKSPAVEAFFRLLVEKLAAKSIRRTKSLLSFSPEKQFLDLLESEPEILQRIPQKYIAQYLGIAPESLSRIKKRLMTTG